MNNIDNFIKELYLWELVAKFIYSKKCLQKRKKMFMPNMILSS